MEESRNETQNISMEEDKEGVDCVFEKQERWHYDYGYEVFTKIDFNIEPAPTLPEIKPKHAIKFSFSSKFRSFSIFFYIYICTPVMHISWSKTHILTGKIFVITPCRPNFCVLFWYFEGVHFKFLCYQVCIPAVFFTICKIKLL